MNKYKLFHFKYHLSIFSHLKMSQRCQKKNKLCVLQCNLVSKALFFIVAAFVVFVAPTAIKKKRYQNIVFSSSFFPNRILSHSFLWICEDAHEYYSIHFESYSLEDMDWQQEVYLFVHVLTRTSAALCIDPLKIIDVASEHQHHQVNFLFS